MSGGENYYIVRGAKMKCDKGTHARKINLPVSHGSYVGEKPMMNKTDRKEDNISYFGICHGECPSSGENIYLISEDGRKIDCGKKCCVKILKDWENAKKDTLVEGEAALTTDSVLMCKYGGKIKFETNGQEKE